MGTLAPPMNIYIHIYIFQCMDHRLQASQDRCEDGSACLLVIEPCPNVQPLAPPCELVFKQLDTSQSQLERGKLN